MRISSPASLDKGAYDSIFHLKKHHQEYKVLGKWGQHFLQWQKIVVRVAYELAKIVGGWLSGDTRRLIVGQIIWWRSAVEHKSEIRSP